MNVNWILIIVIGIVGLLVAQEGHTECVELLLSSGADPDLYCNEDNWQLPIHAAAQMGHTK